MPLSAPTRVLATTETGFGTSTSFTTSAFTPANNTLLVVFVNITQVGCNYSAYPSLTISGGSLSWDPVRASVLAAPSAGAGKFQALLGVYTAQVSTGASMSITISGLTSSSTSHYDVEVYTFTGYNTSSPIGATATGTGVGPGSTSITLSASPASTSYLMAGRSLAPSVGGGTATPGASWSTAYDSGATAGGFCVAEQMDITGVTSTTVNWATLLNGDTVADSASVQAAVEVKQAAGGGTAVTETGEDPWFRPEVLKFGLKGKAWHEWTSFPVNKPIANPPSAPLYDYDRWEENRNKGVPVTQRTLSWEFGRINQPPVTAQTLKEFDQWQKAGIPKSAKADFSSFIRAPFVQVLQEFDAWAAAQRKRLLTDDWSFGPQIPGAPTTPYLGQYDQWVSAQRQRLAQADFQSFVSTPPPVFLGEFDQWQNPVRLRLALQQDWSQFVFVAQTTVAQVLQEFDQFQNKVQLFKPGADFTTDQAINQYVTPATPNLSEYDRWSMAFAPKITQTPFNDFTFIPPTVVAQVLSEFDQWAIVQRIRLTQTETPGFEFVPPVTTPAMAEFDQWVATQRQRLIASDFQGFVTAPSATILREFDQWSAAQKQRLAPSDFASFLRTPLAQVLSSFDLWWQKAKTPLVVSVKPDWAGFVFNPPAAVAQPLRQFDQWQPNWNKGVPVPQRTRFWEFARIDKVANPAPQPLKEFDQWGPQRTATTTGRDFTSFIGIAPSTATTTATDPFVWVKKKKKPLPPVIIERPKKRKPKPEEALLPEPLPELLPEPQIAPPGLVPLPQAVLPPHIFSAPQWTLPQAVTSPPPFRMATPEEVAEDDEDVINLLLEELQQLNSDSFE